MTTWVIFLRGINVGGKNKLPMAELRACLAAQGFEKVTTYIQSGNVVLRSSEEVSRSDIETQIKTAIYEDFGFDISVMAVTPQNLVSAMSANPWGQDFDAPNFMFLFFLQTIPEAPDMDVLRALATENEKIELIGNACYAYAGDGAGRSKMFAKIERCLGVPATARNWRTLQTMDAILRADYGAA